MRASSHLLMRCGMLLLVALAGRAIGAQGRDQTGKSSHTSNWAVLVDASRFWLNYRHISNVLAFYHILKRLGFSDSNIIVMVYGKREAYGPSLSHACRELSCLTDSSRPCVSTYQTGEDYACNPRNPYPACIYHNESHKLNLYDTTVEVDYRGSETSVENFLRLLIGRHDPATPRSKRLLSDEGSNIFVSKKSQIAICLMISENACVDNRDSDFPHRTRR